jgi:hypothetical protein
MGSQSGLEDKFDCCLSFEDCLLGSSAIIAPTTSTLFVVGTEKVPIAAYIPTFLNKQQQAWFVEAKATICSNGNVVRRAIGKAFPSEVSISGGRREVPGNKPEFCFGNYCQPDDVATLQFSLAAEVYALACGNDLVAPFMPGFRASCMAALSPTYSGFGTMPMSCFSGMTTTRDYSSFFHIDKADGACGSLIMWVDDLPIGRHKTEGGGSAGSQPVLSAPFKLGIDMGGGDAMVGATILPASGSLLWLRTDVVMHCSEVLGMFDISTGDKARDAPSGCHRYGSAFYCKGAIVKRGEFLMERVHPLLQDMRLEVHLSNKRKAMSRANAL